MNKENEFEHEKRFYNRFNQEGAQPRDEEEIQAFSLYALIRHQLRHSKTPQYDQKRLVDSMTAQMKNRRSVFSLPVMVFDFRKFAVPAYATILAICLFVCAGAIQSINWTLVRSVQFTTPQRGAAAAPIEWRLRLMSGNTVRVPTNTNASIQLADGSEAVFDEGTVFSIQYDEIRLVKLIAGKTKIHAAPNPEKPMKVNTPLGDVEVIGTVFTVEITN